MFQPPSSRPADQGSDQFLKVRQLGDLATSSSCLCDLGCLGENVSSEVSCSCRQAPEATPLSSDFFRDVTNVSQGSPPAALDGSDPQLQHSGCDKVLFMRPRGSITASDPNQAETPAGSRSLKSLAVTHLDFSPQKTQQGYKQTQQHQQYQSSHQQQQLPTKQLQLHNQNHRHHAAFGITAFVSWQREGKGGSSKPMSPGDLSDSFKRLRFLFPFKRLSTLVRAILSVLLILMATQQLLFLRTVEEAHSVDQHAGSAVSRGVSSSRMLASTDVSGVLGDPKINRTEAGTPSADGVTPHKSKASTTTSISGPLETPAVTSAREWVQEMRLCMMTARALLQLAEDSGDENMVASARQEMDQCMALLSDTSNSAASNSATSNVGVGSEGKEHLASVSADGNEAEELKDAGGGESESHSTDGAAAASFDKSNIVSASSKDDEEDSTANGNRQQTQRQSSGRLEAMRRLEAVFRSFIPPASPITASSNVGSTAAFNAAAAASIAAGLSTKRKAIPHDTPGITRLKRKLEASEQQTRAVLLQSMLYSQLAAKSVPRGLHCLALRLTLAWNSSPSLREQAQRREGVGNSSTAGADATVKRSWALKMSDPDLFHYALFSDNVLAVAVVVNSTATHLKDPSKHVMHIVTDRMNLAAIRAWLALSPPAGGIMPYEVLCLEDFPWLNASFVPVLRQREMENIREFYYRPIQAGTHNKASANAAAAAAATAGSAGGGEPNPKRRSESEPSRWQSRTSSFPSILRPERRVDSSGGGATEDYLELKYRNPKYLSILNHLRFYLPLVFPNLTKVLFLDDDVVVQRDLSPLWKVPMHGKVNLAVETCGKTFHRFKTYLNFTSPLLSSFDPEGCAWAFGMNLFDLAAWRKDDFTLRYHFWQQQNENRTLWKLGTLPAGLLTFYNATEVLQDRSWHVLGLGSKRVVSMDSVRRAGVVHWNGHAKPWLDLANPLYQSVWTSYVPYENDFFRQCNIEPPKPLHKTAQSNFHLLQMLQMPSALHAPYRRGS